MRAFRMLSAAGLAAVATLFAMSARAAEIKWARSFDAAAAEAKRSNKLVMVDFYTDWCGWCKQLDATTYKDQKVVRLADKMVSVKVNAEKEGRTVARKYGVNSFPTILFLDGDGAVAGTIRGYKPAEPFAADVSELLAEQRDLPGLAQRLKAKTVDGKGAVRLAKIYAKRGQSGRAAAAVSAAEKAYPGGASHLTESYLLLGSSYARDNDIKPAELYLRKALRSAKKPEHAAVARLGLSACYLHEKRLKEAAPLVNAVITAKGIPPHLMQTAQQMQAYIQSGGR